MDPSIEFWLACARLLLQFSTVLLAMFGAWWALVTWEHANKIRQAELGRKLIEELRSDVRCENALAMLKYCFWAVVFYGDGHEQIERPANESQWIGFIRLGLPVWKTPKHIATSAPRDIQIFIRQQFEEFHRRLAIIQRSIDLKHTTLEAVSLSLSGIYDRLVELPDTDSFKHEYLRFLIATAERDAIVLVETLFPDDRQTAKYFHEYYSHGREDEIARLIRMAQESPRVLKNMKEQSKKMDEQLEDSAQ